MKKRLEIFSDGTAPGTSVRLNGELVACVALKFEIRAGELSRLEIETQGAILHFTGEVEQEEEV